MGYKNLFTIPAQNAVEQFSGWSGVNCAICKRGTTKAQLLYSMRVYGKPLCRTGQSLRSYRHLYCAREKAGGNDGDRREDHKIYQNPHGQLVWVV
jgi:hypothetical protein